MTDEHENSQSDAPKASASPASPESGEERPWPSEDYENSGTAGDQDEPQIIWRIRKSPAGHPQGRSPENGEPYRPYAEANAGTAGGAGSLCQSSSGFSNCPTDLEAAYYEELASRAEAGKRCAQCRGSPDGKEQRYKQRGAFVWLHPECRPYWLKEHPQ